MSHEVSLIFEERQLDGSISIISVHFDGVLMSNLVFVVFLFSEAQVRVYPLDLTDPRRRLGALLLGRVLGTNVIHLKFLCSSSKGFDSVE